MTVHLCKWSALKQALTIAGAFAVISLSSLRSLVVAKESSEGNSVVTRFVDASYLRKEDFFSF